MKMHFIKERMEVIEELEEELRTQYRQKEEMDKSLTSERYKLHDAVQEYIVALVPKLNWTADLGKNLYGGRRLKTDIRDEIIDLYFQKRIGSSIDFGIKGETFQLWQEKDGYSMGHVYSYEQVQILRDVGVDVSVDILVSLKKSYERKIEKLQEDIDMWTLKKLDSVK
jgi:hypothetical protein